MIDFNHNSGYVPGKPIPMTIQINNAIDEALLKRRKEEDRRNYIGASVLGSPCDRDLFYDWFDIDEDSRPLTGQNIRIFDTGHMFEGLVAGWLKLAGFELRTRGPDGNQFGFEVLGGQIQGHIDGVILSGPVDLPYPVGWEHKGLKSKSWSDVVKRGVRRSKEVYYRQVALYMAYMQLDNFLFTVLNKDTEELYHEIIPFDRAEAQEISDRGVLLLRQIEARNLPPRIAATPDFFICRMCHRHHRCWEIDP